MTREISRKSQTSMRIEWAAGINEALCLTSMFDTALSNASGDRSLTCDLLWGEEYDSSKFKISSSHTGS